jgi:hypothetical protein
MPVIYSWPHRAEEPDDALVAVWLHPTEGPHALDEEGLPQHGPQCAECGSFDPSSAPDEPAPLDEPYRLTLARAGGRCVVCNGCGRAHPIGLARADETIF